MSNISGFLTTHVLDTASGIPAAGMAVTLLNISDTDDHPVLVQCVTNEDGRIDAPLLEGSAFVVGRYRLSFAVADYFRSRNVPVAEPAFLDVVHIDFGIADQSSHYHVPLLVSPYSYSTYRGS